MQRQNVFFTARIGSTKSRTLLSINQQDKLIRLSYLGVPIEDVNYEAERLSFDQHPWKIWNNTIIYHTYAE